MLKFISHDSKLSEMTCAIGNEGCQFDIRGVCVECSVFVCDNSECRTLHVVDYLEGRPKAIYCANCRPRE